MDTLDPTTLVLLIAPVVLLELVMKVVALVSLKNTPATKGPKWAWAVAIVVTSSVGWIAYFLFARTDAPVERHP